jgi:mannose-6-phosphate isomerase-like protein (cupin superfamily)
MPEPETIALAGAPEVTAPDGAAVRPLCALPGLGSFAHFQLAPGEVSRAARHVTVQEIWYVVSGRGQMWRQQEGGAAAVVSLEPGVCLTIPLGTAFQFRAAAGAGPLRVVAVTMPPWPGAGEARPAAGPWEPALGR